MQPDDMNQAMQPPMQDAQPPTDDPSMENMNPQEIEQFKQGFQIARQLLYQEPVFDGMMQDIEKGDPVSVIAATVVQILSKTQGSIGKLSLSVAAAMGIALIDDLLQMIEEIGKPAPDMQQIFQQAVFMWLDENKYPPQEIASELQSVGAPPELIQQLAQQQGQQEPQQPQQQPQGLLAKGMR